MKKVIVLILALMFSLQVQARQMPMEQPPRVIFTEKMGSGMSAEQIKSNIVSAGNRFGWMVIGSEEGKVTLQYNKGNGKHVVTIAVVYDMKGYQINYVDSINMNYEVENGVPNIHPNYNRWVFNLNKEINNSMYSK
ncbi:hypothetical protein HZU75_12680 [Chitinibacter fontanus]|uniref:Lipoprotein n=1 Tax=Chitinibacter fontanus TaxID=1737446 RepID=A0A7D5VAM2_9NEIS|nr:hypothetical protein [Chitinibacter fontanus]QLI82311.1 hypothetical protein HZU75_12680 [Chitinibacter fontanus]